MSVTYLDAIRSAQEKALASDPTVFIYGQDVGKFGGASAEVVARVASEGFELLDAPPKRLNAKDTPIPYHPNLWAAHRPTAVRIAAALREVMRY